MTSVLTRDIFTAGLTSQGTTTVPTPISGTDAVNKTYADSIACPPGSVVGYPGDILPTGWLYCSGQAVSRTTYEALFAAIGTTVGAGDGSTTFNVPKARTMFANGSTFVVKINIIKT
jgi:Phage Tail Collar Domain